MRVNDAIKIFDQYEAGEYSSVSRYVTALGTLARAYRTIHKPTQYIPKGEPCEVVSNSGYTFLLYSQGNGQFVTHKGNIDSSSAGRSYSNARPARFPAWENMPNARCMWLFDNDGFIDWDWSRPEDVLEDAIYVEYRPEDV